MASHHAFAFLLVFIGGGLGSALRHTVNQGAAIIFGTDYPYGTLSVNVIGSIAMGVLAGWFAFRGEGGQLLRLFAATGVLGGFTTFSAFSLDAALLWQRGQTIAAAAYVATSVTISILGIFAGLYCARAIWN